MSSSYQATILADSPIRYYRLNETSGTVAHDLGSQAQNGTLNGGITINQAGFIQDDSTDGSMLFNGSTGYISVPTSGLPTGASAFTMECWIKVPGTIVSSDLMGFGTTTTTENWWIDSRSGAFDLRQWSGSDVAGGTPAINTVFHVAGTYDGTTAKLYINGVLKASSAATSTIVAGIAKIGNFSGSFFNGNIGEVAWYASALTVTQLLNHYNTGIAGNTTVSLIPTNTKNTIIQANDVNQILNVLQRGSGSQEIGHYFLQQPIYTSGGTASWYVTHLSRISVPVSVALDSSDQGQVGFTTTLPSTGTLKPAGFQVFGFAVTGPQPNARVGGLYTTQF